MKSYLCSLFPRVALPILLGVFSVSEAGWAQTQEKSAETTKPQTESGPQKPKRNTGWVDTSDPVALLAMRKEPVVAEAPATEASQTTAVSTTPGQITNSNAQVAALEKQIQEKQKRVALLMRLFVNDERPFLNDPGNVTGNATAAERRKFDQDELLYETAQIARLRRKVEELKTAGKT